MANNGSDKVIIGSMGACIAGDYRYSDRLEVALDLVTGVVDVSVYSSGAVGGMDGPGGSYDAGLQQRRTTRPRPTAKDVMALVRDAVGNDRYAFKRYGKPSQRFSWVTGKRGAQGGRERGLNATLCAAALAYASSR